MSLRPLLAIASLLIAAMLVASAWAWVQLPAGASVPIHWGLDGTPDGFAPKEIGLLAMPLTALLVTGLFLVIPRIEPRREHLRRSTTAYRATAVSVLGLLAVVHAATVLVAVGREVDVPALVSLAAGAMLIVLGNYLGKVRSNFMFGIRTPWTLTSERSWARTHRLGGRWMVVLGLALIGAVVLGLAPELLFAVLISGLAILVVGAVAYSYTVWRDDPERHSNGGQAA